MNDPDLDPTLQSARKHVRRLGHDAPINPQHRAILRASLLHHHHVLRAERARGRWPDLRIGLSRLRHLVLVGPVAVAMVVALFLLSVLPAGGPNPATVEAQHLDTALARTVPTVVAWEWTVRRNDHSQTSRVVRRQAALQAGQRIYIERGHAFLWTAGRWSLITPGHGADFWTLAFADLAVRLRTRQYVQLPRQQVDGLPSAGIRYTMTSLRGNREVVTAWINESSGLVVRLERTIAHRGRLLSDEVADYHYRRSG